MDRTPPPVSLAAALALPRTPERSAEVFVGDDLEVRFAARPTNGPAGSTPARRIVFCYGRHRAVPRTR